MHLIFQVTSLPSTGPIGSPTSASSVKSLPTKHFASATRLRTSGHCTSTNSLWRAGTTRFLTDIWAASLTLGSKKGIDIFLWKSAHLKQPGETGEVCIKHSTVGTPPSSARKRLSLRFCGYIPPSFECEKRRIGSTEGTYGYHGEEQNPWTFLQIAALTLS